MELGELAQRRLFRDTLNRAAAALSLEFLDPAAEEDFSHRLVVGGQLLAGCY